MIEVDTARPTNAVDALRKLEGVTGVTQAGTHLKITASGTSNVVAQVIGILTQENQIEDLAIREPNLDEIFLRLTGSALRD